MFFNLHTNMEFKRFLEALEGMRAKIYEKPNVYGPGVSRDWQEIMLRLAGRWVDIDTQHIFDKNFNAIDPDTGKGFRLDLKHVYDIENDVRPSMAKCGWCGATFKDISDDQLGEECPKCNAWPAKDSAVLDRLRPLVTVEKGKTKIINYAPRKIKTPEGDVWR